MILVGLRLRIENFWASRISKKFPKTEFKILDIHPAKGFSRGILAVTGKHELEKIRECLSILEGITKVEILLDESDIKLLSLLSAWTTWRDHSENRGSYKASFNFRGGNDLSESHQKHD